MARLDLIFHWLRVTLHYKLFWLGGPILLYLWTLSGPFLVDDHLLILKSERFARGETAALNLYRFAADDVQWNELRNRGTCPWWLPETGRLDFFRPVSEWVFYAAFACFGRNPLGHRLLSLVLFAVMLLAVRWMILQTGAPPLRAAATTFFFGISQTVALPITWVCNRQDLLATLGVALAAGAYWRNRKTPHVTWLMMASFAYLFALLAKEIALPLIGVILLHEVFSRCRIRPLAAARHDLPLVAAMLLLAAVYLGYYHLTRPWAVRFDGVDGCSSLWATTGPLSLFLYASVWTLGFPIDVILVGTQTHVYLVAAGGALFTFIAAAALRKTARHDPAAIFFILWAVLFMLPGLRALTASARTLCLATVGWSYLLTGMILPPREEDVAVPRLLRHWFYTANGLVSACCGIGAVWYMNHAERDAQLKLAEIVAACDPPLSHGDTLIVQSQDSAAQLICSGDRLEYFTGLRDISVAHLAPPGLPIETRVEDSRTLLLRSRSGNLFNSPLHRVTTPRSWTPRPGQTFALRDYSVEIAEADQKGFVTALRLRFNRPLDDPRLHFHPPELDQRIARSVVERFSRAEVATP
jgi:hypothetical protein